MSSAVLCSPGSSSFRKGLHSRKRLKTVLVRVEEGIKRLRSKPRINYVEEIYVYTYRERTSLVNLV